MIPNRLQFIAVWIGGLAAVVAVAATPPGVTQVSDPVGAGTASGGALSGTRRGTDTKAVEAILAVMAPRPDSADAVQPETEALLADSFPSDDVARPLVAAIVEERGVFSVYLKDGGELVALRVGDTWQDWLISEIRPDGVFFESEGLPFDFRVFVSLEEPTQ